MAASHWDVFLKKKRTHEASPDDDGPSAKRWQVEAAQPVSGYPMKRRTRELFPNLSRITTPTVERDTPVRRKVQESPIKIRDIVEKYRKHKNNFTNSTTRLSALNKGRKASSGAGSSNHVSTLADASNVKIETTNSELTTATHIAHDLVESIQHSPMLSKTCDVGSKVEESLLELVPKPDNVESSDEKHVGGKSESSKKILLLVPRQAIVESNDINIIGKGSFQENTNISQTVNCENAISVTEKCEGKEINHSKCILNLTLVDGIALKKKIPTSDPAVCDLPQDDKSGTLIEETNCSAEHVTDITELECEQSKKESNNNFLLGIPEIESSTAKKGTNNKSNEGGLKRKSEQARGAQVWNGQSREILSSECLPEKPVAFQVEVEKNSLAYTSLKAVGPKMDDAVKESKCNSISGDTILQSSSSKPHEKGLLPDAGKMSTNANVDGPCDKNDRSFEQRLLQVKKNQLTKWKSCFLDDNKVDKHKKIANNDETYVQRVEESCSELSRTDSSDGSETDLEDLASCKLDHLQAKTGSKPGTQISISEECARRPCCVVSVNEASEDEGEVLNLLDQEVEVKEEVIDDAAFVDRMSLDEVTVQTILSKYSDILPDAIRYLTQYSRGQVPQSTGAVTITPVSKKPNKEGCRQKETCSPYEVEIVTSTNSFSITPITRPKLEFKSEPVESSNSDSHSSSARSSVALPGDVVVSDREEYSDESSDDPDTDATRHLQLVRATKHNIGLATYKPAVIKMSSSGEVIPPEKVLMGQSSFPFNYKNLSDEIVAHKVLDGTISSKVDVGSSSRASTTWGIKPFSAVKSDLTEPVLASNFYVTNKLGMVHKLKGYTTLGKPLEESTTSLLTSINALGHCAPSVKMKSPAVSSKIDAEPQPKRGRISYQNLLAVGGNCSNTISDNYLQSKSTSSGVDLPILDHAGKTSSVASSQKSIHLNVPIYSPRFRTISAHPGAVDLPFAPSIESSNSNKHTKSCTVTATSASSTLSSFEAVCCQASSELQNTSPLNTMKMQPQSIMLPDFNLVVPNIVMTSNQSMLVTSNASLTSVQSSLSANSAAPVRLLGLSNIPLTEANLLLPTSFSNTLLSPTVSGSIIIPRNQQNLILPTAFPNTLLNPVVTSTVNTLQTPPNMTLPSSFSNTLLDPAVTVSVNSRQIQSNFILPTSFSSSLPSSTVSSSPIIPQSQSCFPAQTSVPTSSQSCLGNNSPTTDKNSSQPPTQVPTGGLSTPLAVGMAHTFLFQPASMPGCPKPPLLLIKANSLEDVQNLLKHKKIVIRPNAQPLISFEGLPPTSPDGASSFGASLGEQSQVTTITTSNASSDSVTNTVPSNPEVGSVTNAVPSNPEVGSVTNTVPSNREVGSGRCGPIISLSLTHAASPSLITSNNNINSSVVKTYSKKASGGRKVLSKPLYKNKVSEHTGPFTETCDAFPTTKSCYVVLRPCDIVTLDDGITSVNLNSYFRKLANVSSNNFKSSSKKTYTKCPSRGYSVKHSAGIIGKTRLLKQPQSINNPAIDMSPPSSSQTSTPHKSSSLLSSLNSMLTDNNTHIAPSQPKGLLPSKAGESYSSFLVPSNMDPTTAHRLECNPDSLESKPNRLMSKNDRETNVNPFESNADPLLTNDEALVSDDDPIVSNAGTVDCIDLVDTSTLSNTNDIPSKQTETYTQPFTANEVSRLGESEENPLSIVKIEPVADTLSSATPTLACQSRPYSVQSNSSSGKGSSSQLFVVLNPFYGAGNTPSSVSNLPSNVSNLPSSVSNLPSNVSNLPSSVSNIPSGVSNTPSCVSSTPSCISSTPSGVSNVTSSVCSAPSGVHSTATLVCSCDPLHSCATCHETNCAKKPSSSSPEEDCSCFSPDVTGNEISLIFQSADLNSTMQSSKPRLSVKSTASLTAPAAESDLPSSDTIPTSNAAPPALVATLHCQKNHRTSVQHNIRITPAVKPTIIAPEKWEGAIQIIESADSSTSASMTPIATTPDPATVTVVASPKEENVMEAAKEELLKAKFATPYIGTVAPLHRFGPIYMDYNATTPVASKVADLIDSTVRLQWGNPSSSHQFGREAQESIALARNRIAAMLSARHENIVFTSGGTESNNLAIHSAIKHYRGWASKNAPEGHQLHDVFKKPHVITSNIEHDSVRRVLNCYEDLDLSVVSWEQMPHGVVDNIKPNTCLITVMLANNETGIILPVAHISRLVSEEVERMREAERLFRVLIHTDASQCVGKIPVEVDALGVDYLTLTGHKFYGPRFGALYIRENNQGFLPVYPQFCGGGQERGIRPGTENTPMIAGLGLACELVYAHIYEYGAHMKKMRNYIERLLKRHFQHHVKLNCITPCLATDPERCSTRHLECKTDGELVYPRLPNTTSIAFCYSQVTGAKLLQLCPNLLCSVGAACHSEDSVGYENSVLKQHGVCSFHAARTLRLSVGRETTFMDVDSAVMQIKMAVRTLVSNKL